MYSGGSAGNLYTFIGGEAGPWRVTDVREVKGAALEPAARLDVVNGRVEGTPTGAKWLLRGVVSNLRYATADEVARLKAVQPPLGRPEATHAALIPISKSAEWWALPQDRRRAIFEETSRHTEIGLGYLPAVARRLHHGRDLGEPFDFLTWFEFAPAHAADFDALLAKLRATPEWGYVERETEVRLVRA